MKKKLLRRNHFFLNNRDGFPFSDPYFLSRNSLDGIGCFWYNIGTQQNKNMQTQKSDCLTSVCIFISQIFTGKNGIICPGIE